MKPLIRMAGLVSQRGPLALISVMLVMLILGMAVFARESWLSSEVKTEVRIVSANRTMAYPGAVPARGPVQTVRFSLYDVGIYPRRAKVPAGLVAINFDDLSGGTAGLVVRELRSGVAVDVGIVERRQSHWRGRMEMRLAPGRYEVFDLSRPRNRAELLVEPAL